MGPTRYVQKALENFKIKAEDSQIHMFRSCFGVF